MGVTCLNLVLGCYIYKDPFVLNELKIKKEERKKACLCKNYLKLQYIKRNAGKKKEGSMNL